jgi:hypothetical protein
LAVWQSPIDDKYPAKLEIAHLHLRAVQVSARNASQ